MAPLKRLITKRGVIKRKLTSLENFIRDFKSSEDQNLINELQERLDSVSDISKEFDELHIDILTVVESTSGSSSTGTAEGTDSDAMSTHSSNVNTTTTAENAENAAEMHKIEADNIESRIFTIKSKLRTLIQQNSGSTCNAKSGNQVNQNINLPVINLPQFDGSYGEWNTFYEAFNGLIHSNRTLNNCQKLHYLRSCLNNEPLRSIEAFSITSTNYEAAWNVLKKRYENKRLIVAEHVQTILNFPEINKATAASLRKLIDTVNSHLEALKIFKIPVEHWDQILISALTSKLDYNSRREWESTLNTELVDYATFARFLEKKCITLESIAAGKQQQQKPTNVYSKDSKVSMPTVETRDTSQLRNKYACHFCNKKSHFINRCDSFLKLKTEERVTEIEKRKLCGNCLRDNHKTNECKSDGCKICKSRHHTLLHGDLSDKDPQNTKTPNQTSMHSIPINMCPQVLLSTADILIRDSSGKFIKGRALLDVGSQLNLITESLCKRLNLQGEETTLTISGVGNSTSNAKKSVSVIVKSRFNRFTPTARCFVLSKITENLPTAAFDKGSIKIPRKIDLADEEFNISKPIEILLGAELFWDLILAGRIKIPDTKLILIESQLGWLIGNTGINTDANHNKSWCFYATSSDRILENLIERFWLEQNVNLENTNIWSEQEILCEKHFLETHKRDDKYGRFIVELPFKRKGIDKLGESRVPALKRFYNLERKFRKNPALKEEYTSVLDEYLELGIIERVFTEPLENTENSYYLPHSAVIKPDSLSTKLRIVFDASCKSSNGLSLNDILMTGPNIQNDIVNLLTRLRTYQIVLSADITKMFLQIKIAEKHLDYLRFFWRDSPDSDVKIYRLTRLVFGLTNSPYTAMRCIRQLSTEAKEDYPGASDVLSNDIFMDDIITGAACLEDAVKLRDQLIKILGSAGFELSKYASNDPKLIPEHLCNQNNSIGFGKNKSTKILGMYWDHKADVFHFDHKSEKSPEKPTKRSVLSTVARLFDPLGLIGPVIVKAKIIMQSLWTYKDLNWDSYIPIEVERAWRDFVEQLGDLKFLKIPRKVIPRETIEIDLIAFGDASLSAMGAAIYVRAKVPSNSYYSHLLVAKTRLAPIKAITLPRLELNAAVLAARLMDQTSRSLGIKINKRYFFTDSMIVLQYINKPANNWQIYVARRVGEIQNLTNINELYHVDSTQNPADLLSRGVYPTQLMNNQLYWRGPEWLENNIADWPKNRFKPIEDESNLEKRNVILGAVIVDELPVMTKYSSFNKLVRVIAYCRRFIQLSTIVDERKIK